MPNVTENITQPSIFKQVIDFQKKHQFKILALSAFSAFAMWGLPYFFNITFLGLLKLGFGMLSMSVPVPAAVFAGFAVMCALEVFSPIKPFSRIKELYTLVKSMFFPPNVSMGANGNEPNLENLEQMLAKFSQSQEGDASRLPSPPSTPPVSAPAQKASGGVAQPVRPSQVTTQRAEYINALKGLKPSG